MSLHFIRPEWLLALVPLALVLLSLWRQHESHSAWNRYIAPHLAKILVTQGSKKSRRPLHLLAFTWLIATFALAGPAVNKQSLPVFAAEQGRVLVMDMSVSMFATDLAPNRLTQAKFRATDLLRNLKEGETGLVAFAGDAFTISPLTRDTGTLLNLLPTLSPEIMPVRGSNLAAGLTQAKTLLAQGGHIRGDIIVMTDGITAAQFDDANSALSGTQYRLAVVAFGTSQGAPIRLPDGQLQRDSSNEVVVASTDFGLLQKLAADNKGVLIQNRTDGNDLAQLQHWLSDTGDAKATDLDGETWQDLGPYLALLLLLPALFSFRQGIVASVGFATLIGCLLLAAAPQPAHASVWEDVWKTTDQQAMQAYQSQDYANAAKQFESPQWRGSAQYKAGDYEQALKTFEQDSSAQGLYNQGNALMQLGKPDKAKERYQAALEKQADFPAAKANLELAEKQLKQQQKQQGKNDQQDKNQDQQGDQQSGDSNSGDQQSGDKKSQDKQQSDQDSAQKDKQDQAGQESQDQQDNANPEQSPEQQKADEQQSEQDKQNGNAQDKQDEAQQDQDKAQQDQQAKQQNAEQDAKENEPVDNSPVDNEAKMQAQANADTEEQKSAEQAKQSVGAKEAPEKDAQDKQEAAMSESVEAPPTNSEPLPAEMQRALRGVSEDPQVLLRNKMQLEYQKRRQNGQISKDNEQW
ncbi:vWA domain-containing protein [Shewanella baltica]|uniref:Tetratricopeptide TPR_2 repeat protein n=1 Tax=Shewanella baltica (strain OS155 / ATCC BAA-1091) TaxID=325240 RepID=A3D690_SHEB5|nr:VWA domain-containing protein [Shewanella baltica]ABN62253.1 Tetratricopeptide TPR_2 repeat protein [Shewanella baltica OS155]AEH14597.1 von Willebrand factor type A [Shewanella baltica OS117]